MNLTEWLLVAACIMLGVVLGKVISIATQPPKIPRLPPVKDTWMWRIGPTVRAKTRKKGYGRRRYRS